MPNDFDRLNMYAERHGVEREENESEQSFRKRVADAVLDKQGDVSLATELFVGKEDYHDFNEEEQGLSYLIRQLHENAKIAYYQDMNDTYWNMPWMDLNNVLRNNGFERVLAYRFLGKNQLFEYEFAIWADYERGILLNSKSNRGVRNVSSVLMNFEVNTYKRLEELDAFEENSLYSQPLNMCGYGFLPDKESKDIKTDTAIVKRDGREGLVEYLQGLDQSMADNVIKTNNPWKYFERHLLWLVDYAEENTKGKDNDAVTREKISMLPSETQKMLGVI